MRIRSLLISLVIISLLSTFVSHAQNRMRVSLVLFNGKVFTSDEHGTIAEAIAVDGERIVAVGTTKDIRAHYQGTREIDLTGKLITPGFNDAHIHFAGGGTSLLRVVLNGSPTLEEAKQRIAAKIKELPAGSWVLGRGWDHTLWGGQWPTRADLDQVSPNNPVFVQRVDGHTSWANSLALKKAGITRETKAPEGGEILHDAQGEPTGILKETAGNLVSNVVPDPTKEEVIRGIERALEEARRYGITSIQDNSGYEVTKGYRELLKQGKLTVRVAEWQNFEDSIEELKRQRAEFAAFKDDPLRIRLTALKGYVDGTLGSRTSAMLAPFADDPKNSGIPRRPPEELTRMIVERDAAGFQIALHAIGDRANRMALDGYEAAWKSLLGSLNKQLTTNANETIKQLQKAGLLRTVTEIQKVDIEPAILKLRSGVPCYDAICLKIKGLPRHRIEHAQVVAPSDFARFSDLGVIASMQPSHAISDKRWAQDRLGEYRVQGAYAWHMMQSFSVHVPFGTDWPVEPINPYLGLYAAVTRQSIEGEPPGGWWPQERISIAGAIRCYTAESAYASFEEKEKGQIAVGMLADFAIHSQDLLTIKPEEILKTEAVMTILGGKVIYER